MSRSTTNEAEQLAKLAEEGEHISSIRETPRRKREWAAWRQSCEDARQNCPSLDALDLGLQLTTLAEDVDKLKAHLQSLSQAQAVEVEPPGQPAAAEQDEPESERPFSIFISHKSERDGELARNLREKLLILSKRELEVFISEKIPGAADWQEWVETSVRNCDMLLFLHTTEHDDNRWLLYEAGLYRGSRNENVHLVCLKNPNLNNPPPQLARLQAYAANEAGIKEFFMDLLYRGTFTDGYQVNRHLRDDDEKVFNDALHSIAEHFREQQITVDYFRNRLNIGPIQYDDASADAELVLDEVEVEANDVTRQLLGLPDGSLQWNDIHEQCMESGTLWFFELQEALNLIRKKRAFNQVLTPFDTLNGRTCFPVISRVERLKNMPTSVTVIFVERGPADPPGDHAETLPRAPKRFLAIVTMLNMARRFRWNILSPYIRRLSGFDADEINMEELGSELWTQLLRIEQEAAEEGFTDPTHVADVFPEGYRARIKEYFNDYAIARGELQQAVDAGDRAQLLAALEKMLPLNKRFLLAGTMRYHSLIVGLDPEEITDEDIGLK